MVAKLGRNMEQKTTKYAAESAMTNSGTIIIDRSYAVDPKVKSG